MIFFSFTCVLIRNCFVYTPVLSAPRGIITSANFFVCESNKGNILSINYISFEEKICLIDFVLYFVELPAHVWRLVILLLLDLLVNRILRKPVSQMSYIELEFALNHVLFRWCLVQLESGEHNFVYTLDSTWFFVVTSTWETCIRVCINEQFHVEEIPDGREIEHQNSFEQHHIGGIYDHFIVGTTEE